MSSQSSKIIQHPEHGLLLPIHAKIRGETLIRAYDREMRPVFMRTPSGDAIGPIEGVRHSNLITDTGMDAIGTHDPLNTDTLGTHFRGFLAVGTDSTPPSFADTALGNEVQRASSTGSFSSPGNVGELDTVNDVWRATSTVVRVVQMNQNRNLTEFGLGGNYGLGIHELIRDAGGNPIAISLLDGMFFRCDHTLVVEIDAPENGHSDTILIEEYDASGTISNVIPVNVVWGFRSGNASSGTITRNTDAGTGAGNTIMGRWAPAIVNGLHQLAAPAGYSRVGNLSSGNFNYSSGVADSVYVPGSYEFVSRRIIAAGDLNGAWYGFAFGNTSSSGVGNTSSGWLHVIFDSPATYTKINTTTLRAGMISTWARA